MRLKDMLEFVWTLMLVGVAVASGLRINSLTELQKDASSITIEWSVGEPSQEARDQWVGFKIKYFTEKLQYTPIMLKNILFRKFRLDNLKSNTEYKIQVSAYNSVGDEGPASHLLTVKTYEAVPGEPTDFKLVKVTADTIELEWKPPRQDEQSAGSNVKGYEIQYFKVIDAADSSTMQTSESQIMKRKISYKRLKTTISNLEPNSLYKIQIFAFNMKGDGQRSNQLLVQTMDEGPNKPENIRSEIYNNLLHIKWQPPASSSASSYDKLGAAGSLPSPQKVAGYRLYFNNEKYEVDAHTTQITFQRPKWEYDRQYEFRIAAKSIQSTKSAIYGQEAIYRISTLTTITRSWLVLIAVIQPVI